MTFPTTSDDGRIVLTAEEIAALRKMLDAGDRSGFYLAYYGMTGNSEALLTAKISSFSGNVGGVAFASNWLLQDQYRGAGPAGSSPYAGIYFLSQKVAVASFDAIVADVNNNDQRKFDGTADGLGTPNRLFISSFDAWAGQNNIQMFPGNLLIGETGFAQWLTGKDYSVPNWSADTARTMPGFVAGAQALLYASYFGKQQSDMSGDTIDIQNGFKLTTDSAGRVNGIFGNTADDWAITGGQLAQMIVTDWLQASPIDRADPFAFITRLVTEAAGFALYGSAWTTVKNAWAAELPNFETNLRRMAGLAPDAQITDAALAPIRAKFSEFSGGYTGDVNPNNTNPTGPDPTLTWNKNPTGNGDVLFVDGRTAPGPVDGGGGDDLIFGAESTDNIRGGDGNDIIWGKEGRDKLFGDAGNDLIRGGMGNDTLTGGAGNDTLSGGDLTSAPDATSVSGVRSRDGFDTADYRQAAGKVVIDFTQPGSFDVQKRMFTVQQDGDGGTDTLHSIEKVILTADKDEVIMTKEANKLNVQFQFVGGDNTIRDKAAAAPPPQPPGPPPSGSPGGGSAYVFVTKDEQGA